MSPAASFDPRNAIVPIFSTWPDYAPNRPKPDQLEGTGFFWAPPGGGFKLVTANHVVASETAEGFGITSRELDEHGVGAGLVTFTRDNIVRFPELDLAVIDLAVNCSALGSWPVPVKCTDDVICYEYSQSSGTVRDGAPQNHEISLTRRGHSMRRWKCQEDDRWRDLAFGTLLYEFSFPAIRGASGAPIMAYQNGGVGGVIAVLLGNWERETTPSLPQAVISELPRDDSYRMFVPNGVGVAISELEAAYLART